MAQIQSGASADLLTVDPANKAARASLYGASSPLALRSGADARAIEGLPLVVVNDGVSRLMRGDRFGGVSQAIIDPVFWEPFENGATSASRLLATATGFTQSVAANTGMRLNNTASVTINQGIVVSTRKHFPRLSRALLHAKMRVRVDHRINTVAEWGYGAGNTATTSPTSGAYFQITSAGVVQGVLTINGVDRTIAMNTAPFSSFVWSNANYYTTDVLMDDDQVTFIIQDTNTGLILSEQTLTLQFGEARLQNVSHIPSFVHLRNSGVAPASAAELWIADWMVGILDAQMNVSAPIRAAQSGYGSNYQPLTFGQTAQAANNAVPANATLSNTAAGYATLGGRFGFAAVAGGLTDYGLFAFGVLSPYQLVILGIDIETYNTGAAVATTPTLLEWSIGVNGTSASLATGGHNREFVGAQSFPIGAAIGAKAERVSSKFDVPLISDAATTVNIILRMPVGTATASQVLQGHMKIHGYFE